MNKAALWSESMAESVSWEGRSDLGSPVDLLCGLGRFQAPHLNWAGYHFFSPRGCDSELTKRQNLWQSLSERSLAQRRFDPHKPGSLNILPSLHVQATKFQT